MTGYKRTLVKPLQGQLDVGNALVAVASIHAICRYVGAILIHPRFIDRGDIPLQK